MSRRIVRIVHVITRLIVGGAQENTILTCEGLAARGHDVLLLSGPTHGPEGSLRDRAASGPYDFEEVPSLVRRVSPWNDYHALRALTARLVQARPDVVHTHSSKAGILGRLAAARARVPLVVHTIHGMSFNRTQPPVVQSLYATAERHCARKTDAFITVADAMAKQALAAGIGRPEQFETIRSGINVADFDPATCDAAAVRRDWGAEDRVIVGTVARLFRNKGYEQLIEIMQLAIRQEPRLFFVWIGDGANRSGYEQALRRRGLEGHVRLVGLVRPADMPRTLAAIDVLAHTSQWEGLPRAIVQTLLMEKPAVSFDIDGAPEVVVPGVCGELAPLNDLARFAGALVQLARDAERRVRYGREGRTRCLGEFDHVRMVDRIEALYEKLAAARRGAS